MSIVTGSSKGRTYLCIDKMIIHSIGIAIKKYQFTLVEEKEIIL